VRDPIIMDGKRLAKRLQAEMRQQIIDSTGLFKTTLAVILASGDPASRVYVDKKIEACQAVGIKSYLISLGEANKDFVDTCDFATMKDTIDELNADRNVHGILLQLPLPHNLKSQQRQFYDMILPDKDVDVLTPVNTGLLLQGHPRLLPCTPQAVRLLLKEYGFTTDSEHIVVINRSDIVGKPLSAMLVQNEELGNATVTVCHDHTPPDLLKELCLAADIIVVAVGIKDFLTADMVTANSVVVDVGINRDGNKICGDCHPSVYDKVMAYSPVPGGVGPMTITCLLQNTLKCRELQEVVYYAPACP
jgi:methylenetetrahydrofolate dehydrogenase (NADP+)/methenyltetrahydrofolate cyclohydrolase